MVGTRDSSDHDGGGADKRHDGQQKEADSVMSASIADLWRVGSAVARTHKANATCNAASGAALPKHKWLKCRARSIELMLSKWCAAVT